MANLPPAASRGPGRVLPPAAKREVGEVRSVMATLGQGALERQKRPKKPPRAVEHLGTFRDGHGVLREKDGRFAKETAPRHKRPERKPWKRKRK